MDTKDNLLIAVNEGSGEIVLISLSSSQIVGRFPGVTGDSEDHDGDNHNDHDKSLNVPAITAILPLTGKADTTFTLTLTGQNLQGASDVIFALPGKFLGNSENHGKGNGLIALAKDPAFTVSAIQVNAAGTQLTASITASAKAVTGIHVVIVNTPNGESTFVQSAVDIFTINP